jgi:hypothetical protein
MCDVCIYVLIGSRLHLSVTCVFSIRKSISIAVAMCFYSRKLIDRLPKIQDWHGAEGQTAFECSSVKVDWYGIDCDFGQSRPLFVLWLESAVCDYIYFLEKYIEMLIEILCEEQPAAAKSISLFELYIEHRIAESRRVSQSDRLSFIN